jgi:GNAT superfamily N-acetyltransferase
MSPRALYNTFSVGGFIPLPAGYTPLSGQYRVRWFQESDIDAYIRGLNKTLYEEYDEVRFRWKMVETPYSLGFVSIAVVEYDGVPVAFNSFLPLRVRIRRESFSIIQGCDGFVEPEHRRMGLFQETLRFIISELAGKGPEMLMGFNFAGSAGAAQKVGSALTGEVHALCAKATELAKIRVEGDDGVEVKPCSLEVLHYIYEAWAASTSKLHYHRTPEYLKWRYSHPIRRSSFYRLRDGDEEGYAAVSLERDGASQTLFLEDYSPILYRTRVASALIKHVLQTSGPINEVFLTETFVSSMNEAAQRLGFVPDHIYTLIMRNISGLEERSKKLYRGGVELTGVAEWHLVSSDVF